MEDITHISRYMYMVKFRYPTNKAGSRAQIAVQAVHTSSRETKVKITRPIIKTRIEAKNRHLSEAHDLLYLKMYVRTV